MDLESEDVQCSKVEVKQSFTATVTLNLKSTGLFATWGNFGGRIPTFSLESWQPNSTQSLKLFPVIVSSFLAVLRTSLYIWCESGQVEVDLFDFEELVLTEKEKRGACKNYLFCQQKNCQHDHSWQVCMNLVNKNTVSLTFIKINYLHFTLNPDRQNLTMSPLARLIESPKDRCLYPKSRHPETPLNPLGPCCIALLLGKQSSGTLIESNSETKRGHAHQSTSKNIRFLCTWFFLVCGWKFGKQVD